MPTPFPAFFRQATGRGPYPFQGRFAEAAELPHLLRAPTGAGKTATAVLGWLWRYFHSGKPTPRRLVYCLPMRVLVEQSEREAKGWIEALGLDVPVHVLMGGVEAEDWFLHPERPAVILGTQDMLLSRALNRGYATGRFHWPIDFGLLNTDCLWVFDEPQLMANGVSTSAQLAGLRKSFDSKNGCPSVWMSATLEPGWLDTIDFAGKFPAPPHELDASDYDSKLPLHKRMTAAKTLAPLGVTADKDGKAVAKAVLEKHIAGTQTLVIVNTVDRARAVYAELLKKRDESGLLLVHSRFRPRERVELNRQLQQKDAGDRILVATQVVEAGVDISSRTLVTELAPWASIVQRIGRCNRTGDDGPGVVFWIDLDVEKTAAPYEPNDLIACRERLKLLEDKDVSPQSLSVYRLEANYPHKHVLRRRDLLDLFDTAPDLSGNDIDIARFVRSDEPDADVQVFWRAWAGDPDEASPMRDELCNVPVGQFRQFVKDREPDAFVWDHLDGEWVKLDPKRLRPGLVVLLPAAAGGYSETRGWDATSKTPVTPHPPVVKVKEEAAGSDPNSITPKPLSVADHTKNVCRELDAILNAIPLPDWAEPLKRAARWHDAGKGHDAFQHGVRRLNPALAAGTLWAKSGKKGKLRHGRTHFRHEWASALAALHHGLPFLAAYLIAAHHGRARLSVRALPGEKPPADPETLFALGVHHGDPLPAVELGGETCPATTLDLTPIRLGGDASWTGRALELLAKFGPFKLAYLEALLRAADVRASKKEANGG
jgi:CRISPR-associated endonuclease/helicase Cas3